MLDKKAVKAAQAREAARKAREDARSWKKRKKDDLSYQENLLLLNQEIQKKMNFILWKVILLAVQPNKEEIAVFKLFCHLRGKVINTEKAKLARYF